MPVRARDPFECRKVIGMPNETEKDVLTRRGFLGVSSAALAAAGISHVENLSAQESAYQSVSERSKSDHGPTNPSIAAATPDPTHPPSIGAGGVQTFKYTFSFAHKRLQE